MKAKLIDLFCGAGGLSHGFFQSGEFDLIWGVDIKRDSVETLATNHPEALAICGDIRKLRARRVADELGVGRHGVDVVVAGPPCQGFSSIRPYRSINENDHRNNLFEQLILFAEFFRPRFVLIENVVGLLHHKDGRTIKDICSSLHSLGYALDLRVLNAVHYGVPQKRERVFILGRQGKIPPHLPDPTHWYNGRSMAGRNATQPLLPLFSRDLSPAIAVADAISDLPPVAAGESTRDYPAGVIPSDYARARRNGSVELTLHSATKHTPRMLEIIRRAGTNRWALPEGLTTSGFSTSYSRLAASEPSNTITVNFVHPASNRCIHPSQDRALTPREGARLQGFDDTYGFRGPRTEIVKQIGEAVPPLLSRAIASAILSQW